MPGQPRCWSCGASLPPPEAAAASAPTPARAAAWSPHDRPRRNPALFIVLPIMVVMIAIAVALVVTRMPHQGDGAGISAKQAALNALKEQLMRDRIAQPGDTPAAPPDEITAEAQRTIRRLREENGISEPPADSSGRVHLQSGGTISREEWERAARSLRN